MIFIFSTARSGSTWLGKIFDSHPDVFYLHEPDIDDRGLDLSLKFWSDRDATSEDLVNSGNYLRRLARNRSLRATGTLPIFPKNYRGAPAHLLREALILAGKTCELVGFPKRMQRLHIPNLYRRKPKKTLVIKSVSVIGLAQLFVQVPNIAFLPILTLRHPCGYIASMLRGDNLGCIQLPLHLGKLLDTPSAVRLRAPDSLRHGTNRIQLLAWHWLLENAEAYRAITGANGLVISYDHLANDPVSNSKTLFEHVGLSWSQQTETFLASSARTVGGYYSVYRNPKAAANRWRAELDKDQVASIREIVSGDPIGRQYFSDSSLV